MKLTTTNQQASDNHVCFTFGLALSATTKLLGGGDVHDVLDVVGSGHISML